MNCEAFTIESGEHARGYGTAKGVEKADVLALAGEPSGAGQAGCHPRPEHMGRVINDDLHKMPALRMAKFVEVQVQFAADDVICILRACM